MPLRIDNTGRNKIFKRRATDGAGNESSGQAVKAIRFSREGGKGREDAGDALMVPNEGGPHTLYFRMGLSTCSLTTG